MSDEPKGVPGGRANAAKYTHEELSERAKQAHRRRAARKAARRGQRIFRVVFVEEDEEAVWVVAPDLKHAAELLELCIADVGEVKAIEVVNGLVYVGPQ